MTITLNTSRINGYVYDEKTNEELCGVMIISNNDTTYSDFNGYFEITICDNKTKNMEFVLISYENLKINNVSNNQIIKLKRKK